MSTFTFVEITFICGCLQSPALIKLFVIKCIIIFDYYKNVIWAASLMSCWLFWWQPVAVFAYYFRFIEFLLPARRYGSAGNGDRNVCLSVCPSLRPSVTRRYCVKTKKASVTISSPSDSPKILVFWRQISSQNSKGFPRAGASKKGGVRKFSDFLALSVNISKTVADRAKDTIND